MNKGYVKIKNGDLVLEFKISKHSNVNYDKNKSVMVKFKTNDVDYWKYLTIVNNFRNVLDVLDYFLKNQESKYLKVKVL